MSGLFTEASAGTLRALAQAFADGRITASVSRLTLGRICACPDTVADQIAALAHQGLAAPHLALLLDASAEAVESRMSAGSTPELVWTGPGDVPSHCRDTSVVVRELFSVATRSVLVSSFVVRQTAAVFEPLAARMDEHPTLAVRLFLHISGASIGSRHESEILREFADGLRNDWPGIRRPEVYYDPRAFASAPGDRATWHAKCVLIDDEVAFVTSANFTEWAQQRNVEAGVLLRDHRFATQLRNQFESLLRSRHVSRLPGF